MHWQAEMMLKALKLWAYPKWWLLNETSASVKGRIDSLLVPSSLDSAWIDKDTSKCWTNRCHLIGVEIKTNRADFIRGLEEKQFDRYAETLPALFVLTSREIKTKEVPKQCGHLIFWDYDRIVCRRNPQIKNIPLTEDTAWRIILAMGAEYREALNKEQAKIDRASEKVGHRFRKLFSEAMDNR